MYSYFLGVAASLPTHGNNSGWAPATISEEEQKILGEWSEETTAADSAVAALLGERAEAVLAFAKREKEIAEKGYTCECGCGCKRKYHDATGSGYCGPCRRGNCGDE